MNNKPISIADGIIIGRSALPMVKEGDALVHIAKIKGAEKISSAIDELKNNLSENPFDVF